ncbi:SDR family NAD(P)-dependent oxidoreductase [Nonomuraea sp. NPDC049421]|uniref:NAD-dependent epimerase/dehydratase family protein n=1 Tax=Nonomuraea sp. NPDC049421 TaxID=3155275 RepID=UPI00341EA197
MTWTGRRALVTGASGFIGGHLAARLAALGAEVHTVSRRAATGGDDAASTPADGVRRHQVDLREPEATTELVRTVRPDVLYHLASEVNGARDPEMVRVTLAGNLVAAVNVLDAARAHAVRTVLTGSIEEPRPGNGHAPPSSPYAMAKWAATGYAQLYHRLWELPVTVLRPSMVYGPAQPDTTKLIPYVTLCLLRGERPRLTKGTKLADWIYVDDIVDAYVRAGESDKAIGHTMDIATGVRTSAYDIVMKLFAIAAPGQTPEFGAAPDRPYDITQVGDIAPAAELLGWRPVTDLDDGLRRTVEWYGKVPA